MLFYLKICIKQCIIFRLSKIVEYCPTWIINLTNALKVFSITVTSNYKIVVYCAEVVCKDLVCYFVFRRRVYDHNGDKYII